MAAIVTKKSDEFIGVALFKQAREKIRLDRDVKHGW
jgi:hypothetical protein